MPPLMPGRDQNLNLTLRNHSDEADDEGALSASNEFREAADESGSEMFDILCVEAGDPE
ncbi:MAG: hypothetical protein JKY92_01985 [Magnetovibrio sp.]|nr:hypothetical protein [Magnetovibrio sp.]